MLIAALLRIAKIWKQPEFPSIGDRIKKPWYVQWNIAPPLQKEILPLATTQMDLEGVRLSEINQRPIPCDVADVRNLKKQSK